MSRSISHIIIKPLQKHALYGVSLEFGDEGSMGNTRWTYHDSPSQITPLCKWSVAYIRNHIHRRLSLTYNGLSSCSVLFVKGMRTSLMQSLVVFCLET